MTSANFCTRWTCAKQKLLTAKASSTPNPKPQESYLEWKTCQSGVQRQLICLLVRSRKNRTHYHSGEHMVVAARDTQLVSLSVSSEKFPNETTGYWTGVYTTPLSRITSLVRLSTTF